MAKKSRPSFQKLAKERARQQKRKDKEARRTEAKSNKARQAEIAGEDPDIAGIESAPSSETEE